MGSSNELHDRLDRFGSCSHEKRCQICSELRNHSLRQSRNEALQFTHNIQCLLISSFPDLHKMFSGCAGTSTLARATELRT